MPNVLRGRSALGWLALFGAIFITLLINSVAADNVRYFSHI
jgi:hypothetical protein